MKQRELKRLEGDGGKKALPASLTMDDPLSSDLHTNTHTHGLASEQTHAEHVGGGGLRGLALPLANTANTANKGLCISQKTIFFQLSRVCAVGSRGTRVTGLKQASSAGEIRLR